ncbi:TetR/AcrR family transcriptional regulator [Terribacillus saccharophilus]|uniref:TetR/AcrR family transcriptional regulator n=1 Tax=Terribacillus saccharophilus TaxID=361277 RepID=UPI0039828717
MEQKLADKIKKINEEHLKMTQKQSRIIEAAIEEFSQNGYASTSTSQIAKKAGVAEGTIFRHYKNKKNLLLSIVTPTMTKLIAPFVMDGFDTVFDKEYESFEDFLRAILINRVDFIKENLSILKIFMQEISFHPELQGNYKEYIAQPLFKRLENTIIHFQDNGQIKDLPVHTVIRFTASTVIGFLFTRHIIYPNMNWDDSSEIEQTINLIINGLSPEAD